MNIEDIIKSDELVVEVKEKPLVHTFILVAAAVLAYTSTLFPESENLGFAMTVVAVIVSLMGLKGIIWPRRYYRYKPTKEKIVRKEYYFDINQAPDVKRCIGADNAMLCIEMMEALPQTGKTSLRVIIYATNSGSYLRSQMQKYVPYEYVPM